MGNDTPAGSRIVAVLGMHRSGTSWLAGSLEEKGLELGEVSTADPHNRKGNRENPELMEIHEAVLRDNGGSWKRPRWPNEWSAALRTRLAGFIERMSAAHRLWGFKDPRALLLLDEWLRAAPDLLRVGIFRHPLAVHRSLAARNPRFDQKRSVALWVAYNERLVAELERAPFPLLRFDVPPAALTEQLERAAAGLGLPAADASPGFFDAALVHNNDAAREDVPRACRKLWDALVERALRA